MNKVNLNEIKAQLSKYIDMVEQGEIVVVCKRNVPVAEIRPITQRQKRTPELGWAKGAYDRGAFDSWTGKERKQWEGDESDPLRKYAPAKRRRK